jgi:hypothetical protein
MKMRGELQAQAALILEKFPVIATVADAKWSSNTGENDDHSMQ